MPRPLYQHPEIPNYRFNRTSNENRVIYPIEEKWVNAIGYLVGWLAQRHQIELYAVCFWITHHHGDIGHLVRDLERWNASECPRFSDFITDLHFYLYRLHAVNGWPHRYVMNPRERTDQTLSLDEEQIWHDLCYDTANPVSSGFYEHSSDYPGLCLQPENVTEPLVFERNSLIDGIRTRDDLFDEDVVELRLSVPRTMRYMTPIEYQAEFRRRLDDFEDGARKSWANSKRATKTLSRLDIGEKIESKKVKRRRRKSSAVPETRTSRKPRVNTTIPALREALYDARNAFWDEHDKAAQAIRCGSANVQFPPGTYWWRKMLGCGCTPELEPPKWASSWARGPT